MFLNLLDTREVQIRCLLVTCVRHLLTCDHNLLTCDRNLPTCDRKLVQLTKIAIAP